jgi:hypothetical protein
MEYPLLLSSFIARGWLYGADPSPAVPIATALLVSLALALLLCSTVAALRGAAAGLLAVSILLANQFFLNAAPDQYADLPLAFFGLAAAALLVLDPTPLRSPRYLTLAGVFGGFAAWTKNEGLLLIAAVGAALLVTAWQSAGSRPAIRQVGLFLLGTLPVLCLVLWFKFFVAPPDPLLQRTIDPGRWLRVAAGFVTRAPGVALLLLALAALLLRPRPAAQRTPAVFLPLIVLAIVLAGYFAVFLVAPYDVDWLLSTALERLYLQLWPLLVVAVFLLLRRPEDFAIAEAPARNAAKSRRPR